MMLQFNLGLEPIEPCVAGWPIMVLVRSWTLAPNKTSGPGFDPKIGPTYNWCKESFTLIRMPPAMSNRTQVKE